MTMTLLRLFRQSDLCTSTSVRSIDEFEFASTKVLHFATKYLVDIDIIFCICDFHTNSSRCTNWTLPAQLQFSL